MHEVTSDPSAVSVPASEKPVPIAVPVAVPVPASDKPAPPAGRSSTLLLGIGVIVGLCLGSLLTTSVFATYMMFTRTLPGGKDSLQVFNELNELRQQLNQFNEEKKLKDLDKVASVRETLGAITAAARAPEAGKPAVVPAAMKPGPVAAAPRTEKPQGPFAELDAEIERLENTQRVLNTILDVFTTKKESAKDR